MTPAMALNCCLVLSACNISNVPPGPCYLYRLVIWKARLITLKQRLKGFQLKKENKDRLDLYDPLYLFHTDHVLICIMELFLQSVL